MTRRAYGFSLIELMIALVLGLLLLTGLYSVLGSNQLTYTAVNSSMRLTERGQQVLTLLRNQIQQSGFRNYTIVGNGKVFEADATNGFSKDQIIYGLNALTSADRLANTDEIRLRFYGASVSSGSPATADNTIFDCTGEGISQNATSAAPAVVKLYVSQNNELMCWDSIHNAAQVMANNVENLQFRYMTTSDTSFVNAASVAAGTWSNVTRIEFGFVLTESAAQGVVPGATSTFSLLGESYTTTNNKLRQPFSEVLFIRNQGYIK